MATSYRTTDNHVETLTCSICLNVFTDPRILPCIHTFCKTCILSHIQRNSVSNLFPCPLCRNETQLPKGGIDGIKHNFYIEDCLQQFSNKTLCDTHPGEDLRLYCVTCCVRICRDCKFQKHDEHKSRLFADIVEEKIQSLKDKLEIARPEALAAENVLDSLKIKETRANTAAESCIKQIEAHVEQIHDHVDSLADELIEQIQTDRDWTVNLKTDIKVFTEYITSFNNTEKSVSEIASGKDETWDEMFLQHSELEESLNNLHSPNTHHKSAEDATPLGYFDGTVDKAALKTMVGTVSHTNTGRWMNEDVQIDQASAVVFDENGSHGDGSEKCDADERTEQRNHAIAEGNDIFLEAGQEEQKIKSNLYVRNLHASIDDFRLWTLFSKFGTITSYKVHYPIASPEEVRGVMYEGGMSKGFGFVCFSSPWEATEAVNAMNGREVLGMPLYVATAQTTNKRQIYLAVKYKQPIRPQSKPGEFQSRLSTADGPDQRSSQRAAAPVLQYDRYFLLSLQSEEKSQAKPIGLYEIPDDILHTVRREPAKNIYCDPHLNRPVKTIQKMITIYPFAAKYENSQLKQDKEAANFVINFYMFAMYILKVRVILRSEYFAVDP